MGEEEQRVQRERMRLSLERERALIVRARRRREEIATGRARFELVRDKAIFVGGVVLLLGSKWTGG